MILDQHDPACRAFQKLLDRWEQREFDENLAALRGGTDATKRSGGSWEQSETMECELERINKPGVLMQSRYC